MKRPKQCLNILIHSEEVKNNTKYKFEVEINKNKVTHFFRFRTIFL